MVTVTITGTNDNPALTVTSATINVGEIAQGSLNFIDIDLDDRPALSAIFESISWENADGLVLSSIQVSSLSQPLTIEPSVNNLNDGAATWRDVFNEESLVFLAQGEFST